jgi:hypothetical protein
VRPAADVALRVTRAYNRGSRVAVVAHAIVEPARFTPLVLEIDIGGVGVEPRLLEDEIGCVLPVAARARMTLRPLRRAPHVVRAFEAFFDAGYFEAHAVKPSAKYRRMVHGELEPEPAPAGVAQVFSAGPEVCSLSMLERIHGPAGVTKAAGAAALQSCTVRNVGRLDAHWDGQTFTRAKIAVADGVAALARDWRAAGGNTSSDAYTFLQGYLYGPGRDESRWQLQPWVFTVTPPGWSTVVDGAAVGGCDGMRGVIRTDRFHAVSMVYRVYAPGRVLVPRGAPLLAFLPIPRRLQHAGVRTVNL